MAQGRRLRNTLEVTSVRRFLAGTLLAMMALLMLLPGTALAAGKPKVYVVHIDNWQEINAAMTQYTRRIFEQAEADPGAAAVAVVLDTPGGYVDQALAIKDILLNSKRTTIAYVEGGAISAGALIATAAEKLYMHPGSTVGAAEPRDAATNKPADYKALSVVAGTFESTALARGRDPQIARAMVDKATPIPGQKGELLTLTYKEAVEKRYATGEAPSLEEAIKLAGIGEFDLVDPRPTFSEQAGRFLTEPLVATLLLVVGVIAIGIEFIKPGVTLPGLIGVVCLGLFFLGNTLVGTANWVELALALLGILLLIIEAFIPGFGVFGVGGILSMGAAIFFAVPSHELAWQYLMWTALSFLVALAGIIRAIGKRGLGKALTLHDSARGWTAPRTEHNALVGQVGRSLTVLRPAGTAEFGEKKLDVVSESEFIPAGTVVKIIRVDGTRVVVRALGE
jgi:membrane-bound serine protease (ClpP class)